MKTCCFSTLLVLMTSVAVCAAERVDISTDVVYGHKHGLSLAMDVFSSMFLV